MLFKGDLHGIFILFECHHDTSSVSMSESGTKWGPAWCIIVLFVCHIDTMRLSVSEIVSESVRGRV